jgi:hypothetical protein
LDGDFIASIASFVGKFSVDLNPISRASISAHGFSHRGESPDAAIRFCDAIPN